METDTGRRRHGGIAIVGAGLMGHGIALVMALGGHAVRLTDTETLAAVPGLVASALATLQEAGAAPPDWDAGRRAAAIRIDPDLARTVSGADLVIEAITEDPEAKRALFRDLDRLCAQGRTGVMAGKGFFDWGGRAPADLFAERDRKLLALKRALRGIGRMEGR